MALDLHPFKRKTGMRLSVAAAAICVALGAGVAPVAAAASEEKAPTQTEAVLADFREGLAERAETAGAEALAELERFDSLDGAQRTELANYFLGFSAPVGPSERGILVDDEEDAVFGEGDFTWESVEAPSAVTGISTKAATRTKSVWATQWFKFAGITISETKVSGTYTISKGKATKINSYACTVVKNIDPLASVTSSKNAAFISGGKARMECKVEVRRGVPTPWGQISWSTREAIQYLRANGAGTVEAHGWK